MPRHGLSVLQRALGFEIGGDPRLPEGMATDPDFHIKPRRAALTHAPRVDPVHRLRRQRAGATGCRTEERAFGPSPIPAVSITLGLYRRACSCRRAILF